MRMAIALLRQEARKLEDAILFHNDRLILQANNGAATAKSIQECRHSLAEIQQAIKFLDANAVGTDAKLDVTQVGQSVAGQNTQRHI